jgi:hypothetical protein
MQVADKQQQQMIEARIAELEAEKQKEQAKLDEQKLLQELRKMEATGYNPMVSAFEVIFVISQLSQIFIQDGVIVVVR